MDESNQKCNVKLMSSIDIPSDIEFDSSEDFLENIDTILNEDTLSVKSSIDSTITMPTTISHQDPPKTVLDKPFMQTSENALIKTNKHSNIEMTKARAQLDNPTTVPAVNTMLETNANNAASQLFPKNQKAQTKRVAKTPAKAKSSKRLKQQSNESSKVQSGNSNQSQKIQRIKAKIENVQSNIAKGKRNAADHSGNLPTKTRKMKRNLVLKNEDVDIMPDPAITQKDIEEIANPSNVYILKKGFSSETFEPLEKNNYGEENIDIDNMDSTFLRNFPPGTEPTQVLRTEQVKEEALYSSEELEHFKKLGYNIDGLDASILRTRCVRFEMIDKKQEI